MKTDDARLRTQVPILIGLLAGLLGVGCVHKVNYSLADQPVFERRFGGTVEVGRLTVLEQAAARIPGGDPDNCTDRKGYVADLAGALQKQVALHLAHAKLFDGVQLTAKGASAPVDYVLTGDLSELSACTAPPNGFRAGGRVATALFGLAGAALYAASTSDAMSQVEAGASLENFVLKDAHTGDVFWRGGARGSVHGRESAWSSGGPYDAANTALAAAVASMFETMAADLARPFSALAGPPGVSMRKGARTSLSSRRHSVAVASTHTRLDQALAARNQTRLSGIGAGYPFLATCDELDLPSARCEGIAVVVAQFDRDDFAGRWMRAVEPQLPTLELIEIPLRQELPVAHVGEIRTREPVEARAAPDSAAEVACVVAPASAFLVRRPDLEATPIDWAPIPCGERTAYVPRESTTLSAAIGLPRREDAVAQRPRAPLKGLAPEQARSKGAARDLARRLSAELAAGQTSRADAIEIVRGLSAEDAAAFADAWAAIARPEGEALGVYAFARARAREQP